MNQEPMEPPPPAVCGYSAASRRLSSMRPSACLQAGEIQVRCFVYEAAIFGAQRKMFC
jgi:hypothetical protein